MITLTALYVSVGVYIVILILRHVRTLRRNQAIFAARGCAPGLSIFDPFGLRRMQILLSYMRRGKFPYLAQELTAKYGRSTIPQNLPGIQGFCTNDPENVQYMYSTAWKDFGVSVGRQAAVYLMGAGVFMQDGHAWMRSRALVRPSFTKARVNELETRERFIRLLFRAIDHVGKDGAAFDIMPLWSDLTLDQTTEFLMGDGTRCLEAVTDPSLAAELKFCEAFDGGQQYMNFAINLGSVHWLYRPKKYRDARNYMFKYVDRFVKAALERRAELDMRLDGGEEKEVGLEDKYLFLDEMTKETQDPEEMKAQILNVLVAGRDSTAAMLSWMVWMLVRKPAVMARLRQEIEETHGTGASSKMPIKESLESMGYLQAFLKESNRMFPPAAILSREPHVTTSLPRGGGPNGDQPLLVTKGSRVFIDIIGMHNRTDIWGEDAKEFKPERWLSGELFKTIKWTYIPFGGGVRICLGQNFALTTASFSIVRLLQTYSVIEKDPRASDEVVFTSTPLSAPGDGAWVRVRR